VAKHGERRGPYDEGAFQQLIETGELGPDDLVWHHGLTDWVRAVEIPGLFVPPPLPPQTVTSESTGVTDTAGALDPMTHADERHRAVHEFPHHGRVTTPPSYVWRHWRGELSLARSYWINTVLVSVILQWVAVGLGHGIDITRYAMAFALSFVMLWLGLAAITIWQLIGLWRAAVNHIAQTHRTFWARMVQFSVAIGTLQSVFVFTTIGGPQVNEFIKIALRTDPADRYTLRLLRQNTELEVSGGIGFGLTDEVKQYLDEHPDIQVIHLNSIGGRIAEARKLRDLIASRKLITYSSQGCLSACVTAFLGGVVRVLYKDARLGFHQFSFPGISAREVEAEIETEKRAMVAAGIDRAFVEKAFASPPDDMWKPSPYELLQARAIHYTSDGLEFAMSEAAAWTDPRKLESALLEVPLYQTLKTYDPQAFSQLVLQIQQSILAGDSKAELINRARARLSSVVERYLPYAADNVVLDFTKVIIQEMQYLQQINSELCYALLFPDRIPGMDVTQYFSEELRLADLAVMSRVIETAARNPQFIPTEAQIAHSWDLALDRLMQRYGADAAILAKLDDPHVDKGKVCTISAALYQEVLKLPQKESAKLLRFLFAGVK
jgi:hypothetical protein